MAGAAAPRNQVRGVTYSTPANRAVQPPAWGFWYLRTSKKVWFRVNRQMVQGLRPLFTYSGRPILHRSELAGSAARRPPGGPPPVVWGDHLGSGWAAGPAGTQLYLQIWTRWAWFHPEACARPELFAVEFLEAAPGPVTAPP